MNLHKHQNLIATSRNISFKLSDKLTICHLSTFNDETGERYKSKEVEEQEYDIEEKS